jgi:dTMP kinase
VSSASPRFITLEGGEGAGKSTQARRLAEHLTALGLPVLLTREPGGAPGAEAIRSLLLGGTEWDPVAEAMLVFAARREHVARTIRPALAAGMWVVCDRFCDSTRAYQHHGQGVPEKALAGLAEVALEGLTPDLTLVLDIPPEAGMARARSRGALNRYERLDAGFHARVRAGFLQVAAAEPERCAVIPSDRDADGVWVDIQAVVRERFQVGA